MAKKKAATTRKRAPKKKPSDAPEQLRKRAALEARLAEIDGNKLSRQQIRDIQWLKNEESRAAVASWCEAVPKGDYCRLAQRQHKLIDDAATNYELPLDGPVINLGEALTALHDLIVSRSAFVSDDRAELEKEKLRKQIEGLAFDNTKKHIETTYAQGRAIQKDAVRDSLVWLTGRLRQFGHILAKENPELREDFNDFLDEIATEMESGELKF